MPAFKALLIAAVISGNTIEFTELLEKNKWLVRVYINAYCSYEGWSLGETLLHIAARKNDVRMMQLLVANFPEKIDVNKRDEAENTPLHSASCRGHLEAVRFLVSLKSIKIDAPDMVGNTALHSAVRYGHVRVVECLLKNGVDASMSNDAGKKAIELVDSNKPNSEAIRVLLQLKVNARKRGRDEFDGAEGENPKKIWVEEWRAEEALKAAAQQPGARAVG